MASKQSVPRFDPDRYENWDDEYANAPYIPLASDYPDRWANEAASFRAAAGERARLDVSYGPHERQQFDLFLPVPSVPDSPVAGLVVFVHGGYWMAFDRSYWSHLAVGPLQHGWAVAMPGYVLAPEARISDIARQIASAVEALAQKIAGPLALTGHSAGGHLVSRLVSGGGLLSPEVHQRVKCVASISGVHDLRPLLLTSMNAKLRLSEDEALAESPALLEPVGGPNISCWVGGQERPEFLRQSELLSEAWTSGGGQASFHLEPDRHHFDIIDLLADPASDLVGKLVG